MSGSGTGGDRECSGRGNECLGLRAAELACPICMEVLADPFVTACGHSFCYGCLSKHLAASATCPSCSQHLTRDMAFPNHLLSKIAQRARSASLDGGATAFEVVRRALADARSELTTGELDALAGQLAELRSVAAVQEREADMGRLLGFLQSARQHKVQRLHELQRELACIEGDIHIVEIQCGGDAGAQGRPGGEPHMRQSGSSAALAAAFMSSAAAAAPRDEVGTTEAEPALRAPGVGLAAAHGSATSLATSGTQRAEPGRDAADAALPDAWGKRPRGDAQFEDLQDYYRRLRSKQLCVNATSSEPCQCEDHAPSGPAPDAPGAGTEPAAGLCVDDGLVELSRTLGTLARCSTLEVLAEIPRPSLRASSSIISSLEFNQDGSLFASAGVSKRISVYDYAGVVAASGAGRAVHCPVVELVTRSKLSCLSWNKYLHSHVASSDYDGVVTLWDVPASTLISEYEAHSKRIWAVDFCDADPALLASASDDCSVRLWSTRTQGALAQLDLPANVCSVKWRPGCTHTLAAGCADHNAYVYDLRNARAPLHALQGHGKAVAYVRWAGPKQLASASTDCTLRLWDLAEAGGSQAEEEGGAGTVPVRVYRGHANEKNFVGLTVSGSLMACGSETNEVCVYHSALSRPVARQAFLQPADVDGLGGPELADKLFISAVAWRPGAGALLAANSQGTIKVLQLCGGAPC